METLSWKFEGMHCAGCAQTIEALLAREPGVLRAEVAFPTRSARVLIVEGDSVIGGSINGVGTLLIQVSAAGEGSFLSRVILAVEDARALKPGILHLVDRVLCIYTPTVLAVAALPIAHDISRRSYRKMLQNVTLAFPLNGIGIPAAATGLVYPVWVMTAMAVSVTAIFFNSLWGRPSLFIDVIL